VLTTKTDVKELSLVENWMKKTVDNFGRLNGAVNNAATLGRCSAYDSRVANLDVDDLAVSHISLFRGFRRRFGDIRGWANGDEVGECLVTYFTLAHGCTRSSYYILLSYV